MVVKHTHQYIPSAVMDATEKPARVLPTPATSTPSKNKQLGIPPHLNGSNGDQDGTPRSSVAGSPAPEDVGTPSAVEQKPAEANAEVKGTRSDTELIDRTLPLMGLDHAILTSISAASGEDERKRRDLLGSIMLIGGASKTPYLGSFLEVRLRANMPQYPKEILVAPPPRDLDPSVLVWKGGSIYGKLRMTNDSWIGQLEYDRLGARILNYKAMWHW